MACLTSTPLRPSARSTTVADNRKLSAQQRTARFRTMNSKEGQMTQGKSRSRRALRLFLVLSSLVSGMFFVQPQAAIAIGEGDPYYNRPSLWAPAFIYAEMGYENYGNVYYQFQWDLERNPSSLVAWDNPNASEARSLEIGYKPTGGDNCRKLGGGLNGSGGFPAGVYIGPDFTEDPTDAVLFVGDMGVMAADQRANRAKLYGAWWSCNGPFNPGQNPSYNVQMGKGTRPLNSDSKAQMNYVPAEQGGRGFPSVNPSPGAHTSTWMYAPWTVDWNFENGSQPWKNGDDDWGTLNATKTRNCNQFGPVDGVCYDFIQPAGAGQAWLYQAPLVANSVAPEGQAAVRLDIGANTGLQYEGLFRCPSGHNIGVCGIDIWVKGQSRGWNEATDKRTYNISADDRWYYVLRDNFPAGGATTAVDLGIGTFAKIDVDSQWVSGDI